MTVQVVDGSGILLLILATQKKVVLMAAARLELALYPQTFAGTGTRAVLMVGVGLKETALAAPMVRRY